MPASFVHLRLHTEYSLVDGLVRIKPLVKTLVGMNMPAVAVTDQNNMCSLVKFYKAAMGAGIKPICGADLWLSNKDPDNALSRISLLAMNAVGYRNLTDLPWFHRRPAQWFDHHRARMGRRSQRRLDHAVGGERGRNRPGHAQWQPG